MQFTKKSIYLVLPIGLLLTGCFDSDDDKKDPVNTSPLAVSENLITQADVAIMSAVSGSDAEGDTLSYTVAVEPTLGTLTLGSDGQFTYQPNATVTGSDSFSFRASDGSILSAPATINITIENQVVSFDSYSRMTYTQSETDTPLPTNGRTFTQDVTDPNAYDDLLDAQ